MFKMPELSEEEKRAAEERIAQEKCAEIEKEEQYRRKWCMEQATSAVYGEKPSAEYLIGLAEKIYAYVWGAKQ